MVEPTNGLTIDADPVRLEQALTNLVENAIQHGGGEITVRASESDGDLQIHVEDRGPGFPPEFLDRAFERFSRADQARGGDGTGSGLAIVEAIARAHGDGPRRQPEWERRGRLDRAAGAAALTRFHGRFIASP